VAILGSVIAGGLAHCLLLVAIFHLAPILPESLVQVKPSITSPLWRGAAERIPAPP
jgi:hypothetical protein